MKLFAHPTRLIETTDREGKEWNVVLIQAGKSLNKKFYPSEVLKKAQNLFENTKAFAYEFGKKFFNHLPENVRKILPEGTVKNIVGWYDSIRYGTFKDENGKTQEGLLAKFHVSENAEWLREFLKDAWEHGKKNLLGLSIDGDGKISETMIDGEKLYRVDEINSIDEVTIVTQPAAGGRLLRLLASKNFQEEERDMDWLKKLYEMVKSFKESLIEGIDPEKITEEQELELIKALVEAEDFPVKEKLDEQAPFMLATMDRLISMLKGNKAKEALDLLTALKDKMGKYGYPEVAKYYGYSAPAQASQTPTQPASAQPDTKPQEGQKKLDEALERIKKIEQDTKLNFCTAMIESKLSASNLNELARGKIKEEFKGRIFEEKDIDAAIKRELDYLAKLTESGIQGLGNQNKVEVIADEMDKLQYSMDKMIDDEADVPEKFKGKVEGLTSLKEAYRLCHPDDPFVTGISKTRRLSRLSEAITTADFTYALGTSMTRKLIKDYKKIPFKYDPITTAATVTDFKQQERIRIGGYSTLPTVAQSGTYTDLYEPKDEEATYTAIKKGGLISITMETIKNDDLGVVKKYPSKLAQAAMKGLERDVINLFLANGTYTPTNTTVFSTLFGNYSTVALGYDSLTDSKNRMRVQTERGAAQDSGTATAGASTTLTDSTKSWTTNAYASYRVRLTYGTGAGQIRTISSNTATQITVSAAWTTNPSTDTKYEVSTAQNDDEVIGLEGKYLIHGEKLYGMVDALMKSPYRPDGAEYENNYHKGTLTPIYAPQITGSTYQYYWYLVADKTQGDVIEIGYMDGQKTPTLIVQDRAALGTVFTNDQIRYKIRFIRGLAIIDNKLIDANEATSV